MCDERMAREPVTCARCCRCPPDRLSAQSGGPPNGKSMTATIALVDDDRNILQSLSIALQAEGCVPRVYSEGDAGLQSGEHTSELQALMRNSSGDCRLKKK